ncbi:MAG: XRE family transcriptional regulator [Treponema sp.]|nr:XRE family transcriptional regulator [Treponema sp.]
MNNNPKQIPNRIKELREVLEISAMDMAKDINVTFEVYSKLENGEQDIPISMLYAIAGRLGVDVTVLMTGEDPRMESAAVCRNGKGVQIERYPGYEYASLAYNFKGRTMEPLLVYLDASRPPAAKVSHSGQEFNYVVEGLMKVTVGTAEYFLGEGDSIYFDAALPHSQNAIDGTARFITIIQE